MRVHTTPPAILWAVRLTVPVLLADGGPDHCSAVAATRPACVVKTARELQAMFAAFTAPANYAHQHATEQLDALTLSEGSGNADALPQAFMCPILQELLRDPVLTVDGHTYERSAIEQWLGEHNTSPLTGLPLASTELAPNAQLLTQIASFLAAHPHLRPT